MKPVTQARRWVLLLLLAIVVLSVGVLLYRDLTQPDLPTVGIVQLVSHPALDSIRQGVVAGLAEKGYVDGESVLVRSHNAEGQMPVVSTIFGKLVAEGTDVLVPITTPCAQAAVAASRGQPIVFGAVTDPVGSGVIDALDKHEKNVTGVSDIWPIAQQMTLIKEVLPESRKLGVVYNPGEANNDVTIPMMKDAAEDLGFVLVLVAVSNSAEIGTAASSLVDKADAYYTAADSTVASGLEALISVARKNRIPLFVGDVDSVERGGIATLGINYDEVGRLTGHLVARVLSGESASAIPVQTITEFQLVVNLQAAREMGVTIPQAVLERADRVIGGPAKEAE